MKSGGGLLPAVGSADFSPDGRYRWSLTREWDARKRLVNFVMLNPSTADAEHNDPTTTRCIDFARRLDFGRLVLTNLYAWRATDPRDLDIAQDPVGELNDFTITYEARRADQVVVAWGAIASSRTPRARQVVGLLRAAGVQLYALGTTQSGQPRHPLFVQREEVPVSWQASI